MGGGPRHTTDPDHLVWLWLFCLPASSAEGVWGGVSFLGRLEASCCWGQLSQVLKTKKKMPSGRPAGRSTLDSGSGPGSPPSLGPCTYCSCCLEFFSLCVWQTAVGLRLGPTPPLGSPSPQLNPSPSSPLSSSVTFPEHPHKIPPRPP